MKRNMGLVDRTLRALVAIGIVIFYLKGLFDGLTAIILLTVAGVFLLTSVFAYCPVYSLFNFHTSRRKA